MEHTRMKIWNLFGYLFSIIVTFALIGLIMYGKDHKAQLEEVMYVLTVILVVAFFATKFRFTFMSPCYNLKNTTTYHSAN